MAPANVSWLTNVSSDLTQDGNLLITADDVYFITDGRYENRVPAIPGIKPFIWGSKHPHRWPELAETLADFDTVALDTGGLNLDVYNAMPEMLGVSNVIVPSGFIDRLRMLKGKTELELIYEGIKIASDAFLYTVKEWAPANKASASDYDFRDTLVEKCLELGAEDVSFDPLIAMDSDADTPHPEMERTPRPLKDGVAMLVDWGVVYKGICTDMTRMVVFSADIPEEFAKMRIVQEKWMKDVEAQVLPGKWAWEAGEAYIQGLKNDAGIDTPFHGAGHGTGGAYVHELPALSMDPGDANNYGIPFRQGIMLEAGMIVTNEPGMYIKGVGAWRTENMILVTETGNDVMDSDLTLDPFFV